jgi:Ca2+/H+ antiporter
MAAAKNKCDLALGIAVGSSTQICLCVMPLLVIIGWFIDKPLTMNFQPFEAFTLVLSVIMLAYTISHGTVSASVRTALIAVPLSETTIRLLMTLLSVMLMTLPHLFLFVMSQATWIMGTALFSAYVIIALGFWVHVDESLESNG